MGTVIQVENLSKSYLIGHQSREPYLALRDVMVETAKNAGRRILHPMRAGSRGNSVEEIWALKDVSFEVKQGDRVGIIGRNGAGKSTLLKILSRITEPTGGRVRIKGRVGSLLEVGTGFHPELTGRENIFLNGAILGMTRSEIKRKFDEIVDFSEIEKFLDTPVKRYSSGMYVRLAFAVAANLDPEILVVDEVLAVGDAQFQRKCLGKMEEVGKEGRTILFVSHNLTAIRMFCGRALVLRNGSLDTDSEVNAAISGYLLGIREHVYVRSWTGETDAPKNENVLITSVSVRGAKGILLKEIFTDHVFQIEIEFTVRTEGSFVGFTIILYDNEDKCVFSSISNFEPDWYGKPMPKGHYRSACNIPADFLNAGWYVVTVILFDKGYSSPVILKELLRLEILDGGNIRGDYYGGWNGVIRPKLSWKTMRLHGLS
jgi:lipopolysaccharide transport system ATP-binding protein